MKSFSKIVADFVNIEAYEQIKRYKLLADKFEVATTTIDRWIQGVAKPHPKVQKLIINFIEEKSNV